MSTKDTAGPRSMMVQGSPDILASRQLPIHREEIVTITAALVTILSTATVEAAMEAPLTSFLGRVGETRQGPHLRQDAFLFDIVLGQFAAALGHPGVKQDLFQGEAILGPNSEHTLEQVFQILADLRLRECNLN